MVQVLSQVMPHIVPLTISYNLNRIVEYSITKLHKVNEKKILSYLFSSNRRVLPLEQSTLVDKKNCWNST
jgi:hypothetical protein